MAIVNEGGQIYTNDKVIIQLPNEPHLKLKPV